jgi:hypothetical protein
MLVDIFFLGVMQPHQRLNRFNEALRLRDQALNMRDFVSKPRGSVIQASGGCCIARA